MDDRELDFCIKEFKKSGDSSYFEKIYHHFLPKIYRFLILQVGDKQLTEDLVSEVFLKVYKYVAKVNLNSASIKPWIYKIAKNLLIDFYRKEARHSRDMSLDNYIEEKQDTGILDKALIQEKESNFGFIDLENSEFQNESLLEVLKDLPELQKQVLLLRFVEDLDYRSIGIVLNKNELAIRAIKYRAISKLKEELLKNKLNSIKKSDGQ